MEIEHKTHFFCSYSRDDSAFALKLATELREAGVAMWIDQLDILGGQRWDDAVQAALASSKGIIAIVSPSSSKSQNFMDEVSYALEEGKKMIPVLQRESVVPFRLRRMQRVDFTKEYDRGFADLLRAIQSDGAEPDFDGAPPVRPSGREAAVAEDPAPDGRAELAAVDVVLPPASAVRQVEVRPVEAVPDRSAPRSTAAPEGVIPLAARRPHAVAAGLAGFVGAMMGVAVLIAFASDQDRSASSLFTGVLVGGVPAAVAGALCATNKRRTWLALVCALVGAGIGITFFSEEGRDIPLFMVFFGLPGAALGAILGGSMKRLFGLDV